MARSIMISGPHAIGKSQTAKEISDRIGYLFVTSVAGLVAQKLEYRFDEKPSTYQVIRFQKELTKITEFIYAATILADTIHDRSPLDFAAYLTLKLSHTTMLDNVISTYQDFCIELTNEFCDVLVIPQADLEEPYEDKLGRPKFTKEQIDFRKNYSEELERLISRLDTKVAIIRVPEDKQYDKRVAHILHDLARMK
jgi:deoxyadenosine/deoxycytidine kinase